MLEVFFRAVEDLDQRRHRPLQPRDPRVLELHLRHLLTTDPRTCIVADDGGRVTAFGVLMVREGHAFLSFLFVLPAWQARGIGRAVLGRLPCRGRAHALPFDLRGGRPARLDGPVRLAGPGASRAGLPAARRARRERPAGPAGRAAGGTHRPGRPGPPRGAWPVPGPGRRGLPPPGRPRLLDGRRPAWLVVRGGRAAAGLRLCPSRRAPRSAAGDRARPPASHARPPGAPRGGPGGPPGRRARRRRRRPWAPSWPPACAWTARRRSTVRTGRGPASTATCP